MIREAKSFFNLDFKAVAADANFDGEDFLKFVIKDLKALAVIPHNPRNERTKGYQIKDDKLMCEASLQMYRKGKMRPKRTGILYCQYTCPINYDPKLQHHYIVCPIFHPKFFSGKGCNVLIRLQPSIREKIDYGTKIFKEIYNSRTSVERVFSRLLSITMHNPELMLLVTIQLSPISLYH